MRMNVIIIFFICSLVNVMLSTVKSILTVKASKGVATLINAITYGFYVVVVKQIASADLGITVTITILTNIIGVYTSIWLLEKFKKDNLWRISVTTKSGVIIQKLEYHDIQHYWREAYYKNEQYYIVDIFSHNQKESQIIKELVKGSDAKYNITEINKTL